MRERAEKIGRLAIHDGVTDQHRELFQSLPVVLVGSLDSRDRPWASALVGAPGFIRSPDPRLLHIDGVVALADPLRANLSDGDPVGLLGIQLETRRRARANGTVVEAHGNRFTVQVRQSFGNCPQYIQAREPRFEAAPSVFADPHAIDRQGPVLSRDAAAMVARVDTFFICTASRNARQGASHEGVDVSHRGGKPGFVRVTEEQGRTMLVAPDFRGNSFFNTLGNVAVNPRAGVLFIDFDSGDVLSLTGAAEVLWEGREIEAFAGAERLLSLRIEEGVLMKGVMPLRWSPPKFSPQLAATGSWEDVPRDGGM